MKQIAGDVNAWQYGGCFFDHRKNVIYINEGTPNGDDPRYGDRQKVYEIDVDPYNVSYNERKDVAKYMGVSQYKWDELLSCAMKWYYIGMYDGFFQYDPDPYEMTKTEFYKLVGGYKK